MATEEDIKATVDDIFKNRLDELVSEINKLADEFHKKKAAHEELERLWRRIKEQF